MGLSKRRVRRRLIEALTLIRNAEIKLRYLRARLNASKTGISRDVINYIDRAEILLERISLRLETILYLGVLSKALLEEPKILAATLKELSSKVLSEASYLFSHLNDLILEIYEELPEGPLIEPPIAGREAGEVELNEEARKVLMDAERVASKLKAAGP